MPLASRLAAGGAGAPQYPPSLQPGYPQQPQGAYNPQQQQYGQPPPPPPRPTQGGYGGSPSPQPPYPQQQNYGYGGQQQPQGGYGAPPQPQYGAPPGGQQQYGQQPGGYGQQPPRPGGYQPGPPGGYQQSGPPGGGFVPQGASKDAAAYEQEIHRAIDEQQLRAFYPHNSPRIRQIAQASVQSVEQLCQAWRVHREIATDIVRVGLYDVVIYIDDSGSMEFEENGERVKDLKLILQRVAYAATLFDKDGIDIRFMNEDLPMQEISNLHREEQIEAIVDRKRFKGLTPFGTELRRKVIDPILIPRLRTPPGGPQSMQKPLLIISITDGQPAGEAPNALLETVQYAVGAARNSPYGAGAVAFQFAQVGNDTKATEFLAKLDNDPVIGREVDCTSNYENEQVEMSRANPPIDLTPDLWMMKLILGAIDPSYDTKDEKANMAPNAGIAGRPQQPPGGGYGGGYGQQQQNYNQPPGGGYGGGYQQPGLGGYGQQAPGGYGQQQQGYGQQQQGYGQQQQGYNQQQQRPGGGYPGQQSGGYGAPPPPSYR